MTVGIGRGITAGGGGSAIIRLAVIPLLPMSGNELDRRLLGPCPHLQFRHFAMNSFIWHTAGLPVRSTCVTFLLQFEKQNPRIW